VIALTNARVLDVSAGRLSTPQTLLIDGDAIADIDAPDPAAGTDWSDLNVIDVQGATVMPGLVEAHVHIGTGAHDATSDSVLMRKAMADFLAGGYTTVRDLGSVGSTMFELRAAIDANQLVGPRLVLCGQVISAPCPGAAAFPGMYVEVRGAREARAAATAQVARGADLVKVMVTGALTVAEEDVNPAQLNLRALRAIVAEARSLGVPTAAHAEGAEGVRLAVAAGFDSIEHGEMAYLIPDVLDEMARRGIILVPTLSVFEAVADPVAHGFPPWMRDRANHLAESARRTVTAARKAGVLIAAGADAPPHGRNARELVHLAEAGLTTGEALLAGTLLAARACGLDQTLGSVEVGKQADLVVLDGNPLTDLTSVVDRNRIKFVMRAGRIVGP
jgi:imidazolonepropionase-like amidohydrolase